MDIVNKYRDLVLNISDKENFETRWDNYKTLLIEFKNRDVKVDKDAVLKVCRKNENRFTNFGGYFQVSSSLISKVCIQVLKAHLNDSKNIIINYMLDKNNLQNNLYNLFIKYFDKIFLN